MAVGEREGLHDTLATLGIALSPDVQQSAGTTFNASTVLLALSKVKCALNHQRYGLTVPSLPP